MRVLITGSGGLSREGKLKPLREPRKYILICEGEKQKISISEVLPEFWNRKVWFRAGLKLLSGIILS